MSSASDADGSKAEPGVADGEVGYQYSPNFATILEKLGITLAISTYQAGKVVLLGGSQGRLSLSFTNFDRPMGLALREGHLAVGTRDKVWFLYNNPDVAPRVAPAGTYDSCFLTRAAHVTGEIQSHEMHWSGDELWIVNTLFSCLCTLDSFHSFVPRWRPMFISGFAAEDRCHLNGLAMEGGRPRYVTALGETDTLGGWRENKADGGCLIDVTNGRVVVRGFAMPHSPRVHLGHVWLFDSGRGRLVRVRPDTGIVETVTELPGYARGLAIHGPLAFVGLSRIRETSTFGGVPIAERRDELKCGVAVIEWASGRIVAHFEFQHGVTEVFDVAALPGVRHAALRGPHLKEDGEPTVWVVPKAGPEPHL